MQPRYAEAGGAKPGWLVRQGTANRLPDAAPELTDLLVRRFMQECGQVWVGNRGIVGRRRNQDCVAPEVAKGRNVFAGEIRSKCFSIRAHAVEYRRIDHYELRRLLEARGSQWRVLPEICVKRRVLQQIRIPVCEILIVLQQFEKRAERQRFCILKKSDEFGATGARFACRPFIEIGHGDNTTGEDRVRDSRASPLRECRSIEVRRHNDYSDTLLAVPSGRWGNRNKRDTHNFARNSGIPAAAR